MDELRRAAGTLLVEPPLPPTPVPELRARNARRHRRHRVAGAAVVVLGLVGGFVVADDGPPTERQVLTGPGTADQGRMAVLAQGGIELLDAATGVVGDVDLAFPPGGLAWSPSGAWLLVTGSEGAALVSRDGDDVRPLPGRAFDVAWSPVEDLLAVSEGGVVRVRTPDGRDRRVAAGSSPVWSPDGSHLLFGDADGLHVVEADGFDEVALVDPALGHGNWAIAGLSADNDWVLFWDYGPTQSQSLVADGVPIVARRLDGGEAVTLGTMLPRREWVQWSADGRLALVLGRGRLLADGDKGLRFCDLPAGTCTDAVDQAEGVVTYDPVWSPDGSRIAYLQQPAGGRPELWVADADGGDAHRVPGAGFGAGSPAWDGVRELVYVMSDGDRELAVDRVGADGGLATRIANVPAPGDLVAGRPSAIAAWSPGVG